MSQLLVSILVIALSGKESVFNYLGANRSNSTAITAKTMFGIHTAISAGTFPLVANVVVTCIKRM